MHQGRARGLRALPWPWLGAAAVAAGVELARHWPRHSLRGRLALVTGGSRGLGLALCHELLRRGAQVAFCARDADEVARAERQLERHGFARGFLCDVTAPGAVEDLVAEVERSAPIDVLINNAGQMTVGPLVHMTRQDFDDAMDLHFGGALNTILAVVPRMRTRSRGHIVNIASIGGVAPVPHMAPYVASKFALVGLSRALREELQQAGIFVTTVCPGPMRTGSPFGARFKGRHEDEFAWFATSDALPLVSTGATRAARQIVRAVRSGTAEVVIGLPAKVLHAAAALWPGMSTDLLARIARLLLPAPGGIGAASASGARSAGKLKGTWFLRRTEAAADAWQHRAGDG